MSWHCSRALVEAFSAATCSDGEPSAPSSSTPTPETYFWPDKTTEHSRLSRFGMTFAPLMADRGAALLTWFREASLARTSAQPAAAMAWTASAPGSGRKWLGLLARYDRDSLSWRTPQCSLVEGLDEFSETWPRWGSMRTGECWERETLEHPISESESGSWPTPDANMGSGGRVSKSPPTGKRPNGTKRQITLNDAVKWWPTPTSSLGTNGGRVTPNKAREGGTLIEALSARTLWRTPSASVVEPKSTVVKLTGRKPTDPQVGLADQVGGSLNPTWVEWLMGWPLGWTDSKPSETAKFQQWRQAHGKS